MVFVGWKVRGLAIGSGGLELGGERVGNGGYGQEFIAFGGGQSESAV